MEGNVALFVSEKTNYSTPKNATRRTKRSLLAMARKMRRSRRPTVSAGVGAGVPVVVRNAAEHHRGSPSDRFPVLIGTFSPSPSVLNRSTQVYGRSGRR